MSKYKFSIGEQVTVVSGEYTGMHGKIHELGSWWQLNDSHRSAYKFLPDRGHPEQDLIYMSGENLVNTQPFKNNEWQDIWQRSLAQIQLPAVDIEQTVNSIGYLDYVKEFRCHLQSVPRQTGKTTFIMTQDIHNRVVITDPRTKYARQYRSDNMVYTMDQLIRRADTSRGHSFPSVSCVLVDEYAHFGGAHTQNTERMLDGMMTSIKQLYTTDSNFFVFGLTT